MLYGLLLLSPYLLTILSLALIFLVIYREKATKSRKKHMTWYLIFITVFVASFFLKLSFYSDWLDALLVVGLILAGPLLLLLKSHFKSMFSRIVACLAWSVAAMVICFFALIFYFFGPHLETVERSPDGDSLVKVYKQGGATAPCDYEIRSEIQKMLLLEREIYSEKKLLTPGSSRCQ